MLSEAKHLNRSARKALRSRTLEILRFAQNDTLWCGQLASILTAVGLVITALCGRAAQGRLGFHHFDDITHFEIARWAWRWPAYLLHGWGRPGFTAMYAIPAGLGPWEFGWLMCRLWSAALSAGAAWLAYRVARQAGLSHAWLVVPLCYVQPLFFQLSQTTLTETPLALYLAGAVCLAQRGRWVWSAAIISIAAVTRYETIVFFPVWAIAAWRSGVRGGRLWGMLGALLRAPAAANVGAWWVGLNPPLSMYLESRPPSQFQYGRGGWLTFFARSMEAWGPGVSALAWTGVVAWALRRGVMLSEAKHLNAGWAERPSTCGAWRFFAPLRMTPTPLPPIRHPTSHIRHDVGLVMTVLVVSLYFAAQTAIHAVGSFASGGYARFLVPLSPLVAVLALAGLNWLWHRDLREHRRAAVVLASAMILLYVAMKQQIALAEMRRSMLTELWDLVEQAKRAVKHATVATVGLAGLSCLVAGWVNRRWGGDSRAGMVLRSLLPNAAALLIFLTCLHLCRPLPTHREVIVTRDTIQWLADHGYAGREIISPIVLLDLVTDRAGPPWRASIRDQIEQAPAGVLVALDRQFAPSADHGLSERAFHADPAFRCIYRSAPLRAGTSRI